MDIDIVQTGGRLLAQGAYGCIFTPPLQCRFKRGGPTAPGRLGKLTQKVDIKNELETAVYFKPFGNEAKKYLILPDIDTICKPAPEVVLARTEKDIGECEALDRYGEKDMLQYEIEYGGKTLHTKLQEIKLLEFPFWGFVADMIETGAYLLLNGFIHNDLHSNNILLNSKFHPRLIDFGRSYFANKIGQGLIDEMAAKYMPSLSQITPESSAQDGVEEGVSMTQIYDDLMRQKPALDAVEKVLGVSRHAQIREFKAFWTTSKAAQKRDWITFWRLYWPVVDAWAVGNNIMNILRRLLMLREFTNSSEWKARGPLLKIVLRGLLRTSPRERMDCLEALATLDPTNPLLEKDRAVTWLESKQTAREKTKRLAAGGP
jgi:hypothetical protein